MLLKQSCQRQWQNDIASLTRWTAIDIRTDEVCSCTSFPSFSSNASNSPENQSFPPSLEK